MNEKRMEVAIRELLEAMGEDPDREGLKDTPRRVAGYWKELLEGSQYTNEEIAKMYGELFGTPYQTLIIKDVDNVFSHCEHHLALMYNMRVRVAYLPAKQGDSYKVIGLSKIPRIVEMCAKRLQLQERIANDIAECIRIATGSNDVYVEVEAEHACVSARGVRAPGTTVCTAISGDFLTDADLLNRVRR